MGVDYFVSAAYGVVLPDLRMRISEEQYAALLANDGQTEYSYSKSRQSRLVEEAKLAVSELWGAPRPELFSLMYTGEEDDRPGDCRTPPDLWILGLGMMSFPIVQLSDEQIGQHKELIDWLNDNGAEWHTWVEAG